jgi:hypothetical protein
MPKLHTALAKALVEKDVENAYKAEIASVYPDASITSPYASDGLIELEQARILFEAKYDLQLKVRKESMGVVTQALFYLKKFEQDAQPLPQVILVGDKNECFLIATDKLVKYLKEDIDWSLAPSKPHPKLLYKLIEDVDIAPYVYDIGKSLDFKDVLEQAISLAQGHEYRVKATADNVETLFQRWEEEIFKEKKLKSNDKVAVFLQSLFYPENVYLHPKKNNVLVLDKTSEQIKVDANNYRSFFSMFHQGYLPTEIDAIYAKKDILIEETERRFTGQFYTPAWVNEISQDMISEIAGEDWRNEYLVIDPACGTGNLTRDYQFKDLVLSTLESRDIDIIKEQRYNDGAVILQWDFLNDEIPDEISKKLEEADKVIWYLNPPFSDSGSGGARKENKTGVSAHQVKDWMKKEKLGRASNQLYAQFFYRITKTMQKYSLQGFICSYSVPVFMTGGSFKKFRDWWYKRWTFRDGALFEAKEFSTGIGGWGASFTCWERR